MGRHGRQSVREHKNESKLILTLLTWTKWWAPSNASKWRMGFNSAFKGLKRQIVEKGINMERNQRITTS
jgi:hypothetical protein